MSTTVYNPVIRLVHGTIETIPVTIVDALNELDGFDASSFNVATVNSDGTDGPLINSGRGCGALNNTLLCTIDTTQNGVGGVVSSILATNVPTNPLTVVSGTNDQFQYNNETFYVAAGVYTGLSELAAAMNAAESLGLPFSDYGLITVSGTQLQANGYNYGAIDQGLTFNVGLSHDVLTGFGFTDSQTLADGEDGGVWPLGQYNLYVFFVPAGGGFEASDSPILGPFTFYVI